jgi:ketopantoate reductase
MLTRFRKLCNNVPVNGLNTLFIHSGLEWVVFDETRQLIRDLIEEVMHIAKAWGRNISETMSQDQLQLLDKAYAQAQTNKTSVKTSMAEDFLQKKPLELKAFYKNLLQIAAEKAVVAPKISFLYQVLSFLDVDNRSK